MTSKQTSIDTPIVHLKSSHGVVRYESSYYVTWTDGEHVRITPVDGDPLQSDQRHISMVTDFDTEPFKAFFKKEVK